MKRTLTVLFPLLVLTCATNRPALEASRWNAASIADVKLGQTSDEVRAVLHKGPESTATRVLLDGTNEEVWNYLTDYDNDMNTSITFRNGKVVELAQTKWLGNGKFDEPINLVGPATKEQAARIDTLDTVVHLGMTREAMFNLLGQPTKLTTDVHAHALTQKATYVGSAGTTFVVTLKNNVVWNVTRK